MAWNNAQHRTPDEPRAASAPMSASERLSSDTLGARGAIVSPSWLHARLDDPSVRVIDVRGRILPPGAPGPRHLSLAHDYAEAHVPGAHFLDWTRHLLPRALRPDSRDGAHAELRATLGRMGATPERTVVLYDDLFNVFASRALWVLRALGYSRATVLDGGLGAWREEGFSLTREAPASACAAVTPHDEVALGASDEDLRRALSHGLVIDARLPAAYEGRVGDNALRGHIPGAVNLPYNRLVSGPSGRFARPHELRRVFAWADLEVSRLPDDLVLYCDTGAMAAAAWLAFELVGVRHARIYEAGTRGYTASPTRRLTVGARP